MQNLQGTWKLPCTSQAIYLACKLLARCMEIYMYLATKHLPWQGTWKFPCTLQGNNYGKVHGNFHVPCNETYGKVHGNFHVPCNETDGKVHGNFHVLCFMFHCKVQGNFHGYLAMKHKARYMEISMYLANKTYDEAYLAICFVAGYLVSSIAKKYPCCPKRHRNFRRPALMYKRTLKRFIEHISQ